MVFTKRNMDTVSRRTGGSAKKWRKNDGEQKNLAGGIESASHQIKIRGTEGLSSVQRQTAAINETARFHGKIVDQIRNNARNVNEANGLMANREYQTPKSAPGGRGQSGTRISLLPYIFRN